MKLNYKKTWEMVIHGKISRPLPDPLTMISRKSWLKILGGTFQENPIIWDMHFDELMIKACSRMFIIWTCKYYRFSRTELDLLFYSIILSILIFGVKFFGKIKVCKTSPLPVCNEKENWRYQKHLHISCQLPRVIQALDKRNREKM